MYVPFQTLPTKARLWLYHIPRPLTDVEKQTVEQKLQAFCEQWVAHNVPLQTSFQVLHNQFIALAVDEDVHDASGCSIDSSVRVMREIGELLQADLFNRQYVAYWQGTDLQVVSIQKFRNLAEITLEMEVFDQTVTTVGELHQRERLHIADTWAKQFIPLYLL